MTSPGALAVMPLGFPVARPCMTYALPAPEAVWPATSNSSPKSLAIVAPGTARHWLVWQCRITMGAPAATGTPSDTSRFRGSGVRISNTHSYASDAESATSQKRERLANRVVDVAYERSRFF